MKRYPSIEGLLKRKEAHRRALAALPFEEKIKIVLRLQARRRFLKSGVAVKPDNKKRK
jgi:hypothetical protein